MAVLTADEARIMRRREALAARAGFGAMGGAVAWVVAVIATHLDAFSTGQAFIYSEDWAHWLFMFAPLVTVPLGLRVIARHSAQMPPEPLRWAAALQFPFALPLLLAFATHQSTFAMLLTLPWLGITGLLALSALIRFKNRAWKLRPAQELAFDAALAFIAIGGGWLTMSRWGLRPLDFGDVIVHLTAVHFHYAGFALPILAGCAAMIAKRVAGAMVFGVIAGVPILAAGISSKVIAVEAVAAWILCTVCIGVAVAQVVVAARLKAGVVMRAALFISALTLLATMGLAGIYALGALTLADWRLSIPTMIAWHGTLNVFGFTLPALLVWGAVPQSLTE